jgi:hypothetical protein
VQTEQEVKIAAVIERAKKLLALAQNNDNEAEAAAASAKFTKLMEDHNLDMAVLGKSGKGHQGAPRADKKQKGGLYGWQRELWKSCAQLNMCVYWSLKGLERGAVYEHRILGSEVNVLATRLLAEYLQQTVERLAQDWAKAMGYKSCFVREAIAIREGMAKRLTERLEQARAERIAEDRRKAAEAAAAAKHPSAAPGTGLVLADVIQSEDDLNRDYQYGYEPGTSARLRAEQKAREANRTARRTMWKTDLAKFQETYGVEDFEAMKLEDAREAKSEADWKLYMAGKPSDTFGAGMKKQRASRATYGAYRERAKTAAEERAELPSYREGLRKGDTIGLDKQVDQNKKKALG